MFTFYILFVWMLNRLFFRSFASRKFPPYTVIPMPLLSPSMKTGVIIKWLVKPGDEITTDQLIFDMKTESLKRPEYQESAFDIMQIESQEEGFLAKILVPEGVTVSAQSALAIVCNEKEDVNAFKNFTVKDVIVPEKKNATVSRNFFPFVEEVLPEPPRGEGRGLFMWEAYLKKDPSSPPAPSCSL